MPDFAYSYIFGGRGKPHSHNSNAVILFYILWISVSVALSASQHLTRISVFSVRSSLPIHTTFSYMFSTFKLADSAVTCKNDVLTQPFNISVPPAARLAHSRGSCRERRQTSQTGTDPATVLADCQRSASSPPLTARWMIRLARGQRLPALRADTETRGGRK